MSSGNKDSRSVPYKRLGDHLKKLRQHRKLSLAEASGAVEVDIEVLNAIEIGSERPSEDILLLLISYLAAKDDLATKLWQLAGYNDDFRTSQSGVSDELETTSTAAMVMPADARVVYTDMLSVTSNDYGVVINFMQNNGPTNQPMIVSRLGMSKEHAEHVLTSLHQVLASTKPKLLPSRTLDKKSKNSKK